MSRKAIFLLFSSFLLTNLVFFSLCFVPEAKQSFSSTFLNDNHQFFDSKSPHFSLFVSTDGSDTNPGTEDRPFKTISKAADIAQAGDIVLVKRGTYEEFLTFENSGTEEHPISYIAEEGVVVEGPTDLPYWNGIFRLDNKMYITISGFHLKNSNWFGIMIQESSHITIDRCFVENTEASGIWAHDSDHIIISNSKIRNACATEDPEVGAQECITTAGVNTFQIIYNEVYESSSGVSGGEGIDAKEGCSQGEIAYNLVHNNVRLGIYVDSWNALLSNIKVHSNIVYNNYQGIAVSSENGGTAKNVEIYNNLVYNNTHNGIIIGGWDLNGPRENITIISNTVVNNGAEESSWAGGITIQSHANANNITIQNNIVSDNKFWQIMANYTDKGIACDHNLIDGFRGYENETRGTDYQEGDPGFMDTTKSNFALQETSIAVDNGLSLGAPSKDIIGNNRPQGVGMDIGAYEYTAPIRIDGNTDFNLQANERNWPGDGSSVTPYVIDGYILSGTANNLIEIRNTDVHFQITNCHISDGYFGIYLSGVKNGYVYENTITNHQFDGIFLVDSSTKCIISNNTIYNTTGVGVRLFNSSNNYISSNKLYNHQWSGINLNTSQNNVIRNNTSSNTNVGIELYFSNNNTLYNNVLYNNVYYGFTFNAASQDNEAKWNDLKENGSGTPQVADDGQNNTLLNNYYEDWEGVGSYTFDGSTGNEDPFPVINPYHLASPVLTYPTSDILTLMNSITIQWTDCADIFGAVIQYSVYYSSDNGNSWNVIASDLYSTSTIWNVTTLNDGTVVLLKVQAEDSAGFVSFTISDNTFIVNPKLTETSTSSTTPTTVNTTSAWSIAILFFSLLFILIIKRKKEK
ncbi:MAG: right-handed parallel beta-helix repeat-containing protein [Promethearchaeota archaeon]